MCRQFLADGRPLDDFELQGLTLMFRGVASMHQFPL